MLYSGTIDCDEQTEGSLEAWNARSQTGCERHARIVPMSEEYHKSVSSLSRINRLLGHSAKMSFYSGICMINFSIAACHWMHTCIPVHNTSEK